MDSGRYYHNPIQGVRAHDENNATDFEQIPAPKKYRWSLQDLSANGAGRTENNVMHKKRSGQVVKLDVEWHNLTTEQISTILRAFNHEYLDLIYLDPYAGTYKTACFYIGDRQAPLFNSKRGVWESLSFPIISRDAEVNNV